MALVPVAVNALAVAPAFVEASVADIGFLLQQRLQNAALRYAGEQLAARGKDALAKGGGYLRERLSKALRDAQSNAVKFANRQTDLVSNSANTQLTTPVRPPTQPTQISATKRPRLTTPVVGRRGRYVMNVGPWKTSKNPWLSGVRSRRGARSVVGRKSRFRKRGFERR